MQAQGFEDWQTSGIQTCKDTEKQENRHTVERLYIQLDIHWTGNIPREDNRWSLRTAC